MFPSTELQSSLKKRLMEPELEKIQINLQSSNKKTVFPSPGVLVFLEENVGSNHVLTKCSSYLISGFTEYINFCLGLFPIPARDQSE